MPSQDRNAHAKTNLLAKVQNSVKAMSKDEKLLGGKIATTTIIKISHRLS